MTTLDELRQVFDEDALQAPGPDGVAAAVQTGAARIRRRRRVAGAAGAALLIAVVAVAVPALTHRETAPAPAATPATPARTTSSRDLTVSVAKGSKIKAAPGLDGTLQVMVLDTAECCTEVRVYDPGTFDGTALSKGAKVTVNGHPARYAVLPLRSPGTVQPADPEYHQKLSTVGWQEASGAWVTVYHYNATGESTPADVKAQLVAAADVVRIGPAEPIALPFHFPWVPGELPITYADLRYQLAAPKGFPFVEIGLGGDGKPATSVTGSPTLISPRPLTINARSLAMAKQNNEPMDSSRLAVSGFPAWYYEGPQDLRTFPFLEAGQSAMFVKTDRCYLELRVQDRSAITKADLAKMFENATFDDCADSTTWKKPIN